LPFVRLCCRDRTGRLVRHSMSQSRAVTPRAISAAKAEVGEDRAVTFGSTPPAHPPPPPRHPPPSPHPHRGIRDQGHRPVFSRFPLQQATMVIAIQRRWRSRSENHASFLHWHRRQARIGWAGFCSSSVTTAPRGSGQNRQAGRCSLGFGPCLCDIPCHRVTAPFQGKESPTRYAQRRQRREQQCSCFSLLVCHCPAWRAGLLFPAASAVEAAQGQIIGAAQLGFVQRGKGDQWLAYPYIMTAAAR